MHSFRRLTVWKKAHELALRVHRLTGQIPQRRFAELTLRLREMAPAAAVHIARGSASLEPEEFARALDLASGAARTLDYHLLLAAELEAIERSEYTRLNARIDQICVMLAALRRTVLGGRQADPGRHRRQGADVKSRGPGSRGSATNPHAPGHRPPSRPGSAPTRHRRPDRSPGA
jgi:four helix bundle protein